MNEQILRGREKEQGKEHCVLCLTPPGEAAGGDCQEQGIVLRWLSSGTLCGHGCIHSPVEKLLVQLSFVSSNIVYQVVPTVSCGSCL